MNTHKTKGIVLRSVKYGDTSIIVTMYTELFGVQSYLVKGVRQSSKKSSGKAIYFQPGAMLEMVVYHNEFKNLHFIKEYDWSYLYQHVFFDVVKNTVAIYMIEVLQHCLKQPEANPALFSLVEDTLKQLDHASPNLAANLALYYSLHLSGELGFKIQGCYSAATPLLDLQEGQFVDHGLSGATVIEGELARAISQLLNINFYNDLDAIHLSRNVRQDLIKIFQNYLALHVHDFGEIKSLPVLQALFR